MSRQTTAADAMPRQTRSRPAVRSVLGLLAAAALNACAPPPAPRPTAGDCVTLRLWTNGFHTDIALPATLLEPDNPIRRLYPEAAYFLIGWGDRDYYMDPDPGWWKGFVAAAWPTPSTIHIIAHDRPVEETVWREGEIVDFSVSQAGAARLVEGITDTVTLDAQGAPIILGEGHVPGLSVFVAAEPAFHFFHMCNHWTAARLRDAGVPIQAWRSFRAWPLVNAVRRKAPPCADWTGIDGRGRRV